MSVTIRSAGSLRAGLEAVADMARTAHAIETAIEYGPSGLLRERIEAGEPAHLLASADMGHPQRLWQQKLAMPPMAFAGNSLRLILGPGADLPAEAAADPAVLIRWLQRDDVRIATSTPGLDPSGDYAWAFFEKAGAIVPGSFERLTAKACQAVGGRDPMGFLPMDGLSPVSRLFKKDRADVFVGYATSAQQVASQVEGIRIVSLPPELALHTTCGLAVIADAPPDAFRFACLLLSVPGQALLRKHGYGPAPAL